jgi:hypothetical protein
VYAANSQQFNFSDNGDPTGWEVQNSGAGSISYTTSFGSEDVVQAFSQLQGRLAVFGRRSVQLWTADADPNNFAWIQTLDNSGTQAPQSVLNLGDYDCLYLDDSGVRSLRAKEVTSNAFIDDIGSAIDDLIQALVYAGGLPAQACAVVEPISKNYWLSIPTGATNTATIYVLSRHPAVKQTAWSTFNASYRQKLVSSPTNYDGTGTVSYAGLIVGHSYYWLKGVNDTSFTCGALTLVASGSFVATATTGTGIGTLAQDVTASLVDLTGVNFKPQKFVVYRGQVYTLGTDLNGLEIWQYGGANGNLYDGTPVTAQLPWLDDKAPDLRKKAQGVQFIMAGQWAIDLAMDPKTGYKNIVTKGSQTAPNSLLDSSYDIGRISAQLQGTHFSIRLTSSTVYGLTTPAVFSSISFAYNRAGTVT